MPGDTARIERIGVLSNTLCAFQCKGSEVSKYKVFISYSRKDYWIMRCVQSILQDYRVDVKVDERSIPFNLDFRRSIQKLIDESQCALFLWTKNSVESEWCQFEASHSVEKAKNYCGIMVRFAQEPCSQEYQPEVNSPPIDSSKLPSAVRYINTREIIFPRPSTVVDGEIIFMSCFQWEYSNANSIPFEAYRQAYQAALGLFTATDTVARQVRRRTIKGQFLDSITDYNATRSTNPFPSFPWR